MKFDFLRFTVLILSFSIFNVKSSIIIENNYSYNAEESVIRKGNTELLRWDLTVGMTIEEALSMYSSEGFRLANEFDVDNLVYDWFWGEHFKSNTAWAVVGDEYDPNQLDFYNLFGCTYSCDLEYEDYINYFPTETEYVDITMIKNQFFSKSYFAMSDGNGYGIIDISSSYSYNIDFRGEVNGVTVRESNNHITNGRSTGRIAYNINELGNSQHGVMLIREVPEPPTLAIFALGVIGLVSRRFKK